MKYVGITIHGHYLQTAVLGLGIFDVTAGGVGFGANSIFERVEYAGDEVTLRALNGRYITAAGTGLILRPELTAEARFLEVWWNDDRVSLRSRAGFFICAEDGGGGLMSCDRPQAADWEKFFYEVPPPELLPEDVGTAQQPEHVAPKRDRVIDVTKGNRLGDVGRAVIDVDPPVLPVDDNAGRIQPHRRSPFGDG